MSAYVILDIKVFDPLGYEEYKRVGAPTIVAYGGKPLARGGGIEVAEGDWNPKRLVVIEFKSMEDLKRWWNSPEYNRAKEIRHRSAETKVVFLEGL